MVPVDSGCFCGKCWDASRTNGRNKSVEGTPCRCHIVYNASTSHVYPSNVGPNCSKRGRNFGLLTNLWRKMGKISTSPKCSCHAQIACAQCTCPWSRTSRKLCNGTSFCQAFVVVLLSPRGTRFFRENPPEDSKSVKKIRRALKERIKALHSGMSALETCFGFY